MNGRFSDWPRAAALLAPALARDSDGWPLGELHARLAKDHAQLWMGRRSAVVTEIVREPRGLEINCWLAGGDLREIAAMAPGIEAWARSRGCTRATLAGRRGWARVLAVQGYAPSKGEIVKEL